MNPLTAYLIMCHMLAQTWLSWADHWKEQK